MDSPETFEQVSPEWIESSLLEAGLCNSGDVVSVRADSHSVEVESLVGQVVRIRVEYSHADDRAPKTVIAKFPAKNDFVRDAASKAGVYQQEADVYALFREHKQLAVPRCYAASPTQNPRALTFLFEDVNPARSYGQVEACNLDHAMLVVESIARIHGTFWGREDLPSPTPGVPPELMDRIMATGWPIFHERFQSELHDTRSAFEFARDNRGLISNFAGSGPVTLAHADLHLENVLFPEAETTSAAIVDWQLARPGNGAQDLSYFLVSSLEPEVRRENEQDFLRRYHDIIVDYGIRDYGFDQLWLDYRATAVKPLARPISTAGGFAGQRVRSDQQEFLDVIFRRTNQAAKDLDPVDAFREVLAAEK